MLERAWALVVAAQQANHASSSALPQQNTTGSGAGANPSDAGTLAGNTVTAAHQPAYGSPPAQSDQNDASVPVEMNASNSITVAANSPVAVPQDASASSTVQDRPGLSHHGANGLRPDPASGDYTDHMQQYLSLDQNMI